MHNSLPIFASLPLHERYGTL